MSRTPLSLRHPVFYFFSVWLRRFLRCLCWRTDGRRYASERSSENLPFRIKQHESALIRKLGDSNPQWQRNKVTNLRLAAARLDGILIRPGETFSFCRLVGRPTRAKGYLEGMELSFGAPKPGIGGGLCQLANLIHWLVLHSPLQVVERHHHSYDPFPDDGRVVPFGSGATVFYNYLDYRVANPTSRTLQFRFGLTDTGLNGELRSDEAPDYAYRVYEKSHQFLKIDGVFYRTNEIWREKCVFRNGSGAAGETGAKHAVEQELMARNFARVLYVPPDYAEACAFPPESTEKENRDAEKQPL